MTKFRLALGVHNHQPIGNFEHVFERAHQEAYGPFLQLIGQSETIRLSLHQSGILWQWQEKAHPEYFELVRSLVAAGRLELMTGGYYEPILISIPERDALGQIARLNDYLGRHFGVEPRGLWLTERIWEPHLPRLLQEAGVEFLPLDDTHFIYAGMELKQLTGPFVTEHEGCRVTLLPIQKRLRYLIPFGTVDEVMAELQDQAERNPGGLAVYADDGEKFGVWPDTHHHCYVDGWVQEFFEAVAANSDWLEVIPLSEAARSVAAGRAYLPSASYGEMLHWALPPAASKLYEDFELWLKEQDRFEKFGRFVRGGHWRGFLAKYDEANLMHKRMLAVSDRLRKIEEETGASGASAVLEKARDRLYAGQCNCPYWHGVFGGLYLPHIRQAVQSCLIEADSLLDRLEPPSAATLNMVDYDFDGQNEVVLSNESFTAIVKPSKGGTLLDLALKTHRFCPTDTLTRRHEAYHLKLDQAVTKRPEATAASIHDLILAKEEGLKAYLIEDWYLKRGFIDHFFTEDVDFDRFRSGKYGEEGDFIIEPFDALIDKRSGGVDLRRDGHLWRPEGPIPLRLVKRYGLDRHQGLLSLTYELSTGAGYPVRVRFGVENNFNLQAGHAEDRFITVDFQRPEESWLDTSARHEQHQAVGLTDSRRDLGLLLTVDRTAELWRCPIFTVSLSEGGFEKVYQGTTLVQVWSLVLTDEPTVIRMELKAGTVTEVMAARPQAASVR